MHYVSGCNATRTSFTKWSPSAIPPSDTITINVVSFFTIKWAGPSATALTMQDVNIFLMQLTHESISDIKEIKLINGSLKYEIITFDNKAPKLFYLAISIIVFALLQSLFGLSKAEQQVMPEK